MRFWVFEILFNMCFMDNMCEIQAATCLLFRVTSGGHLRDDSSDDLSGNLASSNSAWQFRRRKLSGNSRWVY